MGESLGSSGKGGEQVLVRMMSRAQIKVVEDACAALMDTAGPLIPILHAVQDKLGFVPRDAVSKIALALNLSIAEVHGVLTFYHYFRTDAGGRHVVHLCRAEACQSVGGAALEAHAQRTLGIQFHGTTPDGSITLEPVYCLGNCSLGPALMIDKKLHGRISEQRFDQLVAMLRRSPAPTTE